MSDTNLTSKEKLDKMLGIKPDQSIDDFLNDLDSQTESISNTFAAIDDSVKSSLQKVDDGLKAINAGTSDSILTLKNIDLSMKEAEDMIGWAKKLFKHIYENICTSDLIDAELVGSAAKMLESIHINLSEFIDLYREKQRFVDKIKLMILQQEQKKELMILKHQHDLEKINMRNAPETIDVPNATAFNFDDIAKALDQQDKMAENEMTN